MQNLQDTSPPGPTLETPDVQCAGQSKADVFVNQFMGDNSVEGRDVHKEYLLNEVQWQWHPLTSLLSTQTEVHPDLRG